MRAPLGPSKVPKKGGRVWKITKPPSPWYQVQGRDNLTFPPPPVQLAEYHGGHPPPRVQGMGKVNLTPPPAPVRPTDWYVMWYMLHTWSTFLPPRLPGGWGG